VADVVIRNDGDVAQLEARVDDLWEQLRARGD
jgi:dephospho-CoA kinase